MSKKIIVFVYNSSPLLGRSPPFTGAIFSWFKEDKYLKVLNKDLIEKKYNWIAKLDDTEADIDIIKNYADMIICSPGLQYQFYTGQFDKSKIIYLTTLEYSCNDTKRVIEKANPLSF
ncbi:hypothetical protein [Serratia sp. UGAL515B_01]|uniref:hypothetical protein n=1 Tax=Serratia sp. UGAL515B_01 TaxID=2986763 RepID=UPI0029554479|nr:hypothetical protein [Serratia sp. UGAL515B_01]WON77795.1 hypothetical protein OK023_03655 [Serratia sp. UGAL515B_01]